MPESRGPIAFTGEDPEKRSMGVLIAVVVAQPGMDNPFRPADLAGIEVVVGEQTGYIDEIPAEGLSHEQSPVIEWR